MLRAEDLTKVKYRKRTLADVIMFSNNYIEGDEERILRKELLEDKIEDLEQRYRKYPSTENHKLFTDALKEMRDLKIEFRNNGSLI